MGLVRRSAKFHFDELSELLDIWSASGANATLLPRLTLRCTAGHVAECDMEGEAHRDRTEIVDRVVRAGDVSGGRRSAPGLRILNRSARKELGELVASDSGRHVVLVPDVQPQFEPRRELGRSVAL
jgi:hypothetical protein